MNDLSNRHLTEDDVAAYLDDRNNSPKDVVDHINGCADCAGLVASVLECAAYEDAVETIPLTATQKKEKLSLVKKLLENNSAAERGDVPTTRDAKKPKSQRGDWRAFFTGVLGGHGVGDLFDSGANSPIPALGDKGESPEDPAQESVESSEDSPAKADPEDFLQSPITNDNHDASIDLEIDDSGTEEDLLDDKDHGIDNDNSDIDDLDPDIDGRDDDSPLDW